ncbi:MAG: CdvA-like protein [Candidatus Bathyarchaeota archaeon]|nr:MAG: CdvA-like protein [Candidatus Bathyarchaeota archaeon]
MFESTSNLFSHLGKPIKDEYGHVVGTIASFLVTPGGRVDGVFIEHGDGHIKQYSSDQIKTENEEIMLFSTLKMQADNFCNQIPLLWRKTQAIKDLNDKKKIPEEMYGDLYSSFEGALSQLKAEAESTIAEVESEVDECTKRVKALNSALINLEIEKEIGQIDEESYQTAVEIVKEGLKRINSEKNTFEALRKKLSNLILGESQSETADEMIEQKVEEEVEETVLPPSNESLDTTLPEPPESPQPSGESPVVVYVKNAEEQSS